MLFMILRMCTKAAASYLKHYPSIRLETLKKTTVTRADILSTGSQTGYIKSTITERYHYNGVLGGNMTHLMTNTDKLVIHETVLTLSVLF
jgi:hypothetical protein